MKKIFLYITVLSILTFIMLGFSAFGGAQSESVKVKWVYDGDTVLVTDGHDETKVRVLGIDCPESYSNDKCKRDGQNNRNGCAWQIPRGKKAKKRAIRLLKNQTVALECSGKCKSGTFNRKLRYIRLPDGRDFGLQLIKEGLCEDFSWKFPHPRQNDYKSAQNTAKKERLGIWK